VKTAVPPYDATGFVLGSGAYVVKMENRTFWESK